MLKPLRIGLTGGIGAGKSTVAAELVRCGAVLVDTDAIARELTAHGGAALPALRSAFGDALFTADGALDRTRMRELAFGDRAVRERLEAILHPLIAEQALRQGAAATAPVVVYDIPLLTAHSAWRARVDFVLVVDCEEQTQLDRVARRSGWDRPIPERVMAQQITRVERRALADAVIYNEHLTLEQLGAEVDALWRHWMDGVAVEQSAAV